MTKRQLTICLAIFLAVGISVVYESYAETLSCSTCTTIACNSASKGCIGKGLETCINCTSAYSKPICVPAAFSTCPKTGSTSCGNAFQSTCVKEGGVGPLTCVGGVPYGTCDESSC